MCNLCEKCHYKEMCALCENIPEDECMRKKELRQEVEQFVDLLRKVTNSDPVSHSDLIQLDLKASKLGYVVLFDQYSKEKNSLDGMKLKIETAHPFVQELVDVELGGLSAKTFAELKLELIDIFQSSNIMADTVVVNMKKAVLLPMQMRYSIKIGDILTNIKIQQQIGDCILSEKVLTTSFSERILAHIDKVRVTLEDYKIANKDIAFVTEGMELIAKRFFLRFKEYATKACASNRPREVLRVLLHQLKSELELLIFKQEVEEISNVDQVIVACISALNRDLLKLYEIISNEYNEANVSSGDAQ